MVWPLRGSDPPCLLRSSRWASACSSQQHIRVARLGHALSDYVSINGLSNGIVVAVGVALVDDVVTLALGMDDEDLYYAT